MTPHAAATARGLLTAEQVGAKIGLSGWTVRKLARLKKIQAYRFGYRTIRFKHSDVETFIESRMA
jgi:excisionase family DNA binding protein